ncbi:MAG: DUF2851 family protein [Bacteroidales bacterium]|jgi:hypothetical protein
MNEDFLSYLWKFQLFSSHLVTANGLTVQVLSAGMPNLNSGPDFFNAKVKIGDTLWAGNIEIHTKSSHWYKHQHQDDEVYNNIILHVVYEDDLPVRRKNGELIPAIELKGCYKPELFERYEDFIQTLNPIPCHKHIHQVNHFTLMGWYDSLMVERLKDKTHLISLNISQINDDFNEIFYQKICRNFGFKTNADAMEQLARSLPLGVISKHRDNLFQIEALLYGQAGLLFTKFKDTYANQLLAEYQFLAAKYMLTPMDRKIWRFMRMRPANFPTIRIAQLAGLLNKSSGLIHSMLEADKLSHLLSLFNVSANEYWNNHYHFGKKVKPEKPKKLGIASIRLIVINTIVPFLFIYNRYKKDSDLDKKALDWLEQLPAEKNSITRQFLLAGIESNNSLQSQALIQLKSKYCDQKRCLECRIGHELLNS